MLPVAICTVQDGRYVVDIPETGSNVAMVFNLQFKGDNRMTGDVIASEGEKYSIADVDMTRRTGAGQTPPDNQPSTCAQEVELINNRYMGACGVSDTQTFELTQRVRHAHPGLAQSEADRDRHPECNDHRSQRLQLLWNHDQRRLLRWLVRSDGLAQPGTVARNLSVVYSNRIDLHRSERKDDPDPLWMRYAWPVLDIHRQLRSNERRLEHDDDSAVVNKSQHSNWRIATGRVDYAHRR